MVNERGKGYRLDIIDKQVFESLLKTQRTIH